MSDNDEDIGAIKKLHNKYFELLSDNNMDELANLFSYPSAFKGFLNEIENVKCINGKLYNGYKNSMPYDLIFINGCLKESPIIFLNQLDNVGRLVGIESINLNIKKIVQYFKNYKILERKEYYIVNAPLLL